MPKNAAKIPRDPIVKIFLMFSPISCPSINGKSMKIMKIEFKIEHL